MFVTEKELSVEVAEVDSVEIDEMNFTETRKDEVLQQFAADATCANKQNF
jgi:hypothetical protein